MHVDYAKAVAAPSPNYWQGRQRASIRYIVMHGTAGAMPGCLSWLDDPASDASVHYLVAQDGTVYQLVSEADSAWGNGVPDPGSPFYGGTNPNLFTISVEHERGDAANTQPISAAQQAASTALVADIRRRHGHLPLIPHSLINPVLRANCPGPGFPLDAIDKGSAPVSGITWIRFTATPRKIPLSFADKPGGTALYVSKATLGTALHFDGWAYGPAVIDPSTGQPDRRWYHRAMPGYGWVASADVLGNAPGSTP